MYLYIYISHTHIYIYITFGGTRLKTSSCLKVVALFERWNLRQSADVSIPTMPRITMCQSKWMAQKTAPLSYTWCILAAEVQIVSTRLAAFLPVVLHGVLTCIHHCRTATRPARETLDSVVLKILKHPKERSFQISNLCEQSIAWAMHSTSQIYNENILLQCLRSSFWFSSV